MMIKNYLELALSYKSVLCQIIKELKSKDQVNNQLANKVIALLSMQTWLLENEHKK